MLPVIKIRLLPQQRRQSKVKQHPQNITFCKSWISDSQHYTWFPKCSKNRYHRQDSFQHSRMNDQSWPHKIWSQSDFLLKMDISTTVSLYTLAEGTRERMERARKTMESKMGYRTCPPRLNQSPNPSSQAPERCQVPAVPLVDVRNDTVWCLDHFHWVPAKQFPLVLNELSPEPSIRTNDGSAGLDPGVSFGQGNSVVLHEVRQTEWGGAAHPSRAVHQDGSPFAAHAVDLISHTVKIKRDRRMRHVGQWHFHILHVRPVEVGQLDGGVHHTGNPFGQEEAAVGCHIPPRKEQGRSDLGDAPQQAAGLGHQSGDSRGHHWTAVMVVVMVILVVEEPLTSGTHGGAEKWDREIETLRWRQDVFQFSVVISKWMMRSYRPLGAPHTKNIVLWNYTRVTLSLDGRI